MKFSFSPRIYFASRLDAPSVYFSQRIVQYRPRADDGTVLNAIDALVFRCARFYCRTSDYSVFAIHTWARIGLGVIHRRGRSRDAVASIGKKTSRVAAAAAQSA